MCKPVDMTQDQDTALLHAVGGGHVESVHAVR